MNSTVPDYGKMDEYSLVELSRNGDDIALEFIFESFGQYIRSLSRRYFLIGAEKEDIIQEGMIGLFKAIRDYKNDRDTAFRSFAVICIERQIKTALKSSTRLKHLPLNSSVSMNLERFPGESYKTYIEMFEDKRRVDPEELVISNEKFNDINEIIIKTLSKFELDVLTMYNSGMSYKEISIIVKKNPKSIDNALQRIKRKLEKYISKNGDIK